MFGLKVLLALIGALALFGGAVEARRYFDSYDDDWYYYRRPYTAPRPYYSPYVAKEVYAPPKEYIAPAPYSAPYSAPVVHTRYGRK